MPNTELQQETALAEVSPATSEELEWCQRALSAVPEPQRELFAAIPVDVRAVCCMPRPLSPRASSRLSSVSLILNATGKHALFMERLTWRPCKGCIVLGAAAARRTSKL